MSYKAAVLYDYPIAYYPLDDLTTTDITDYTEILSEYNTYQDILDDPALSMYANIYGDIAYDHSGCENDGLYVGDPETAILPIVAGNSRSTKITNSNSVQYTISNDYTATPTSSQFATASSSDNDFTIEFWFYPSFSTTNETPLVADSNNNIGVFYEKGNITFKADTESISYTLPYLKKSFHVACMYNPNYINIYIDGILVAYKSLNNFTFTNSTVSLSSGPTLNASDYFLINSVAVYRYNLSEQSIAYHIQEAKSLPAINVAGPENGEVFNIYDNDLTTVYRYQYPFDKGWNQIIEDGLTYFSSGNYLQTTYSSTPAASTIVLDDFFLVPSNLPADSSKVEWVGDNGVSVAISTDGVTYSTCVNGEQIPGYTLTSFGSLSTIYVRITFTSSDVSKFLPKLFNLKFSFYNNQKIFAENGNSYITTLEGDNAVSNYNISFGLQGKDILSRDYMNGLRTVIDSGFHVTTENAVNTVEFFYTPSSLSTSGLISSTATNGYAASNISWNNLGTMSKTNISALYVNGVNKTSETNVSNIFKDDQLHHVVVVFGSAVSNEIRFNYSLSGSVPALYQNIALYPDQFTSTVASSHYDYYIRRQSLSNTDSSTLTMTEDGPSTYNNDWLVIQNI